MEKLDGPLAMEREFVIKPKTNGKEEVKIFSVKVIIKSLEKTTHIEILILCLFNSNLKVWKKCISHITFLIHIQIY